MIGNTYISSSIHLHIAEEILPLYQIKSYFWYTLIQTVRQLPSHYSQQPGKYNSNADRITCNLTLALMASYEIEESFLFVSFSHTKSFL